MISRLESLELERYAANDDVINDVNRILPIILSITKNGNGMILKGLYRLPLTLETLDFAKIVTSSDLMEDTADILIQDQLLEEKANCDLHSLPDDEVVSIYGFEVNSDDDDDFNNTDAKVQQLESSITQKVADKLEESVPALEFNPSYSGRNFERTSHQGTRVKDLLLQCSSKDGKLTLDEVKAQLQEMQRLEFLKQKKEKTEEKLKELTPAQALKLAEFKAKRKRMLEAYNHYINSSKDGKLTLDEVKAQLQEMQRLEFLKQKKEKTEEKLKELTPAQALKLAEFKAKRKRMLEASTKYKTQRYQILAKCKASMNYEGLPECKASANNLRRIQVKDNVKKVEDRLKTYSSAGMDIS
nr:hypothetical protein [Tanacetum cinerariifolium]